jgi:hypothetical protein
MGKREHGSKDFRLHPFQTLYYSLGVDGLEREDLRVGEAARIWMLGEVHRGSSVGWLRLS